MHFSGLFQETFVLCAQNFQFLENKISSNGNQDKGCAPAFVGFVR